MREEKRTRKLEPVVKKKKKDVTMNRLIMILQAVAVLLPPVFLIGMTAAQMKYTALLSGLVIVLAIIPFFLKFELDRPKARDMVPIAVMSVIAAMGRAVFAPIPSFMPTSAIVLIGGMQFGAQAGFLTGALSALASNLFLGQGPWTPWQMYAWGMIGFLGGILEQKGVFRRKIFLYGFAILSGVLFGWFMNLWTLIGYVRPITIETIFLTYAMSLTMDLTHSASNVLFLALLEKSWGKKLGRLKVKYGILQKKEKEDENGN